MTPALHCVTQPRYGEPRHLSRYRNSITRCLTDRYWLDLPHRQKIFFFSEAYKTGPGTHPTFYSVGTGASSMRVKRPECDVHHSPPTSAE